MDIREKKRIMEDAKREASKHLKTRAVGEHCYGCGYNRCLHALHFHHINEKDKLFPISAHRKCARNVWDDLANELRKCVLLCARCHSEVHAGMRQIPKDATFFNERYARWQHEEWFELYVEKLQVTFGDDARKIARTMLVPRPPRKPRNLELKMKKKRPLVGDSLHGEGATL